MSPPAGSSRRLGANAWKGWIALGLFAALAYYLVAGEVKGWVFTSLNMLTAVAVLLGVRYWCPKRAVPWLTLGIGLALYGYGKTMWYFSDLSLGSWDPLNQIANVFFGLGYMLVAISLFLMMKARDPENLRTNLLDASIVIAGTSVLWWVFLVQPVFSDGALPLSARLIGAFYPIMDVVLLAMLVGYLMAPVRRTLSEKMVGIGLGSILLADGLYYWAILAKDYDTGGFSDLGWILGFVLLGAAALHPMMAREPVVIPGAHRRISGTRLAAFVTAAMVGPVFLGVEAIYGDSISIPAFVFSSVGLFLLVLARVVFLLRDVEAKAFQIDDKSRSLTAAEEKYRTLVEQIPAVTYLHMPNAHNSSIYISPRIEDLLGFSADEWTDDPENWIRHLHPEDKARVLAENERKTRDGAGFAFEYRMIHRDGRVVWIRDEGVLVRDASGEPAYWQGLMIDITQRKDLEEQLAHQAFHDSLTGLANRVLFADRVQHALSHRGRSDVMPLAVLFIDLDDFKTINDSLGHGSGDELLRLTADRIERILRLSDTAARLGGDEFAVLVEDMETHEDAAAVADRITDAMAKPFSIREQEVSVRASIGIAVSKDRSSTVEELLRNADLAMYMAKKEAKGGHAMFEPEMYSVVVDRMQMKADLEKAIEHQQLSLKYQPIVELETYEVTGAEALVRWDHPQRGSVPPSEFILLAEETGLVEEIGLWVLREACRQVKLWSLEGIELPVNVNVSGHQLQNPAFPRQVAGILSACGVEPGRITLEITESALMKDAETSASILGKLRRLGVKLAVDDFGTGYSSLSYLQSFPVDILKIDRSFVRGIEAGSDKIALVRAVIKLGRELKLATVGEGVEVPKQAEILRELGCSRAQGFYFSEAVDPAEMARMTGALTWVDGSQEVCDTSALTSTTSPGFNVGIQERAVEPR